VPDASSSRRQSGGFVPFRSTRTRYRALTYGRRTALATVCGNAAGNYVVAVCVAIGIGTVLERSAAVFTAVKLAGRCI
jgi:threonine/homoserine/homoserine lactone efflux protein